MQVTINDVQAMLAEVFEEPADTMLPERKLESIDAWDSVGVLTLMAELDEQYNITLATEEIQNLSSIAVILELLKQNGVSIVD
jgi:acyl carrier protein